MDASTVPMKAKQNMLRSTNGWLSKICPLSTPAWNPTKTMCKKQEKTKNQGQGGCKNPTYQLNLTIHR